MERRIYAIVVAGGCGTRMGAALPKQFLELEGKAILQRSIEAIVSACPSAKIITVLPQESINYWEEYCELRNFSVPQIVVKGGITRFHSVKNALAKVPDNSLVLVHDGVRPLVTADLVRRLVDKASQTGAAIPVLPVTDTLKILNKNGEELESTDEIVDRSRFYGAQTPQVFFSEFLQEAYLQAFDTAYTDDASVVLRNGKSLSYVQGERLNLKITNPEDLVLAEAILRRRD